MSNLIELIKEMQPEEVGYQIIRYIAKLPKEELKMAEGLALIFCYDRKTCALMELDYSNLQKKDYNKLFLYSCCVIDRYENWNKRDGK
jgi:hypothetical protein